MDELEPTQQRRAAMNMKRIPKLILPIVFVVILDSCSKPTANSPEAVPETPPGKDLPVSKTDHESCLQATEEFLGHHADILKCGHLTDAEHLEAVAAIRVQGLKDDEHGIPISKLVILRRANSQWKLELNVDKEITNSAGYVGFNFIDDSHPFPYYRVCFVNQLGACDPSKSVLGLTAMTRDGKIDKGEIGSAIGWNPAVGRFQELEPQGEEFAPEVKNPKHIRSSK